ncbi:hypothetical protein EROP_21310 [Erysipelotrichaceae bacterium OPF54]|nr:hypothetical protein EROP_21310 [Erysipelotrichaceae bacterium OPF54]
MKLSRRRTNCMKASILVGLCVCITGCTNTDYIECRMNDERQKLTDVEIRSISDNDIVQNKVLQNGYIMLQWCDVKDVHMFDNDVEHLKDRKVSYNSFTQWSPEMKEELASVEAYGMDPGLGIRNLHEQGITGKGVSIAIIDQPFDPNHIEYEGKIREYEIYNTDPKGISMHGPAVTSIAVGENCGVAPDADVCYIGQSFSDKNGEANLKDIAKSIDHILEKMIIWKIRFVLFLFQLVSCSATILKVHRNGMMRSSVPERKVFLLLRAAWHKTIDIVWMD